MAKIAALIARLVPTTASPPINQFWLATSLLVDNTLAYLPFSWCNEAT